MLFPTCAQTQTRSIAETHVCFLAGWDYTVCRDSSPRVVSKGLPDHTGGGGGRQEHQPTGGTRNEDCRRHSSGLVGLCASDELSLCKTRSRFGWLTGNWLNV